MKKIVLLNIFALLLASFISFAGASTLITPVESQQSNPFIFSARIASSTTFTSAQIFYDNRVILSVDNTGTILLDSANSKFVLNSFTTNESSIITVYIVYAEKSSGTHTIKILAYNNGDLIGDETKQVLITNSTTSSSDISTINNKISSLESALSAIQSKFALLDSNLSVNLNSVLNLREQVSSTAAELNRLKSQVSASDTTGTVSIIQQNILQNNLAVLESQNKTLSEKVLTLTTFLEKQTTDVEKISKDNTTSFIVSIISVIIALVLAVVLVIAPRFSSGGFR